MDKLTVIFVTLWHDKTNCTDDHFNGEKPQRILNPQYVGEEVYDVHVFLTPKIPLASLYATCFK